MTMSYGTVRTFRTKKAFREAVETDASAVGVFGTSMFGNENAATAADLARAPGAIVVGPDVYTQRNWYASVYRKKDGSISVK